MKNFVQDGQTIDYKVTGKALKSGDIRMIEDVAAVAVTDGAIGDTVAMHVTGVYELAKGAGAIKQGQKVYDAADGSGLVVSDTGNKYVGCAWEAAAAGAPTVCVKINA